MMSTFLRWANPARHTAKEALQAQLTLSPYPVIQKCPSPTCDCADMPKDLDIEQQKPLNGTMPSHSEQLLISSGQSDWAKKIENEKDTAPWGEFAYRAKKILGRGGEYYDPYHGVAINTCSFEIPSDSKAAGSIQALLFPSFRMVEQVEVKQESVLDFVKTFLLPQKLHPHHDSLPEEDKRRMTRDTDLANSSRWAGKVKHISAPTIMVCSHHTRDSRCGILGPLLHAEFTQYINKRHTLRNRAQPQGSPADSAIEAGNEARSFTSYPEFRPNLVDQEKDGMHPVNVGMISHVGGHAWAGNVIVYIPPEYCSNPVQRVSGGSKPEDTFTGPGEKVISEDERGDEILEEENSLLSGKVIWYGRVEPKHVEGIVEQTIGHGKIIGELFRGGVNADGSYIRI